MCDEHQKRTAIVYDFDGTLAPGNVQEHSLLDEIGVPKKKFWLQVKELAHKHDADEILVYMQCLLEHARKQGNPSALTRESLRSHGKKIPFFDGVETWFDRVNQYAGKRGLKIEHYIISSGNYEIISECTIAKNFKQIFASKYIYDDQGKASWPGVCINYTTKTQYLFRINKGIYNSWDNESINRYQPMEERPIPFSRMIFIGDGATDIPAIKMVRHQGGEAIAVFDPNGENALQKNIYRLIADERVTYVAPANYTENGQLDITLKGILGKIARANGYRCYED